MSKRGLDKKSGEPPKKKSKPNLERQWTATNPETGRPDGRLHKIDIDYRILAGRRRTSKKKKRLQAQQEQEQRNAETTKSKSKSPKSKTKSKTKTKTKTKSNNNDNSNDNEEEDDDIKVETDNEDDAKFHLKTQRFKDHVCVVTGAGKDNLGRAVALRLAQEGAYVIILDKQQFNHSIDAINEECAKDGIKPKLEGHRVNVTDEAGVKDIVKQIVTKHGFIDVLVNCVTTHGKDRGKLTENVSTKDITEVFDVNVNGTLNMCKAVLPYMQEEDYGRIVNLASLWGKTGRTGHIAFSAAQAAIIAATKVMGQEYAQTGVTINCVAPSFLDDRAELKSYNMTVAEMEEETVVHRVGELEEVAGVIAFVASEENTYTTGFCYDISGGMASF